MMKRNVQRTLLRMQARAGSTFKAVNPYTNEVAWEEPRWTRQQGNEAVARAEQTGRAWRSSSVAQRTALLTACSAVLRERADEIAQVIAAEMGKPIAQGKGEAIKCSSITDYYAEHAESLLRPEMVEGMAGYDRAYVTKQPLGIVLLLMPWNFPFWQVFRQASAALAAGNVVVCKHAVNVPRCARLIEEIFQQAAAAARVPAEGVYTNLPMTAEDIGDIMSHSAVRAISLTGSSGAGAIVGAAAGKLLKPSVLELGGSDPSIVLEDADIDLAATCSAEGRMLNAGQSCIGSKRFIVVDSAHEDFVEALCEKMAAFRFADPTDPATRLGPLVDKRAQKTLDAQAKATVQAGAQVALQGGIPDHPGAGYLPTVLIDVPPGSPGYEEELFGPVACVFRVKDEAEAIAVANSSKFGLGASVYTRDVERGNRIARDEIEAGMCYVNDFVKSHPAIPFGGVKDSGYGRECGSYGINSFCNIKSVVVRA
ncbi:Succinate-semialdehyde dehydrogenase [Diplonema papillatum]|nr:Succinate-semialdehyde dehydrogenase [Diplonema papillatum]